MGSKHAASAEINDGAVSGKLPEADTFAVHYPGYPSSTDRAVDTLGGLNEIAKTRRSESSCLELRFRPEDSYSRPTVGELRACTALILKISKTGSHYDEGAYDEGAAAHEAEVRTEDRLSAQVVARVNQAYHFEGMADYQHVVAVHASAARRKRQRESGVEPDLDKDNDSEPDPGDAMMILPQFFSLKNMPEKIVLNPSANLVSKNIQKGVVEQRWEMEIEPCLALPFDTERIPFKVNWEDNIQKGTSEWEWHNAISELFEERPIWPRLSLHERLLDDGLQVTGHQMRRLLFRTGYYFSTGPFQRFWIKKGYDPRKDPEARLYQKVDFRMHPHYRYLLDANTNSKSKQKWKDICRFQVFPSKVFVCLQFFELADDFIQQEIRKPLEQKSCSHATGWLSNHMLVTLRLHVSIRFLSIFPKSGVENLLRSTCESFDKHKKMEALSRFRESEREHHLVDKDSNVSAEESFVEPNCVEHQCEDESNNVEVEDEEDEELDGYETPDMEGEEGAFALDARSFETGENVPSDYLQELLHDFPLGKDFKDLQTDNIARDAGLSDTEYEIYEQDSDDSCNGDELL